MHINCEHCGRRFRIRPYQLGRARCCSRKCLWHVTFAKREAKRLKAITGKIAHNNTQVSIKCKFCKKPFKIPKSKRDTKFFCSHACYGAWQQANNLTKYKRVTVDGERMYEHRWIMEQHLGRRLRLTEQIDHINRDRGDNRIANLRILTIHKHGAISSAQRGVPF